MSIFQRPRPDSGTTGRKAHKTRRNRFIAGSALTID
jgi:hypothetical protein